MAEIMERASRMRAARDPREWSLGRRSMRIGSVWRGETFWIWTVMMIACNNDAFNTTEHSIKIIKMKDIYLYIVPHFFKQKEWKEKNWQ